MTKFKSFRVKDNLEIKTRLLQKGDREILHEAFKKLSDKSKRLRFLSTPQKLSNKELDYLTNIDNKNHLAVCACIDENNTLTGIGVSRYIKLNNSPNKAEIAITIIDEYQKMGIGKVLIDEIIPHAKANGIDTFVANAFYFNNTILSIINQYEYTITSVEDGVLKIEIEL